MLLVTQNDGETMKWIQKRTRQKDHTLERYGNHFKIFLLITATRKAAGGGGRRTRRVQTHIYKLFIPRLTQRKVQGKIIQSNKKVAIRQVWRSNSNILARYHPSESHGSYFSVQQLTFPSVQRRMTTLSLFYSPLPLTHISPIQRRLKATKK
jgi:hypothetical protein